jgi:hypothetical protein
VTRPHVWTRMLSISQLNREISHENVVALKEVILEDKSIYMVFEYAEHDFLVRSKPFHPFRAL